MRSARIPAALLFGLALVGAGGCGKDQPKLTIRASRPVVAAGGSPVTLTATLVGSADPIAWSLTPAGLGNLSPGMGPACSYTPPRDVASPRSVAITATAGSLTASVTITVDTPVEPATYMGPEITLELPARGAILMAGTLEPGPVVIGGRACDPVHTLTAVKIGTETMSPSGDATCHPFRLEHTSRWGLSIVHGEATNDAGEKGYLAQSFIRSPTYFSATDGDPASRTESGILLQLNAPFIDDGDRSTLDDIASIVQLGLGKLSLDAVVGNVRFASPDGDRDGQIDLVSYGCVLWTEWNKRTGFEAWKNGPVTHAGITVDEVKLESGGISARITVWGPRVPFGVMGNLDSGCLGDAQKTVAGDATAASLTLDGRASVGLDAQGRPQFAFEALSARLSGLRLDIDLGVLIDWTGLGSLIGDAIAAQVQGAIQGAIRDTVRGELNAQLANVFTALAGLRESIALPAVLGGIELVVESGIDHLEVTAQRAVIGSYVHVRPATPKPEHLAAAPFGAMMMGGARPNASAFSGTSVVLGVKDDALNQFLHAAWLGGAFDIHDFSELTAPASLDGIRLSVFSNLPPVLMPRQGGASGLDLGWGDLSFELTLSAAQGSATVKGFLSGILTIERLEVDPGGKSFSPVFGTETEVQVQITEVNWDHRPTTRKVATEIIQTALKEALPRILAKSVRSFPLPRLDLKWIDASQPGLTLSLQDPQMTRLEKYHVVAGAVAAQP
jgi:hypothetical protein